MSAFTESGSASKARWTSRRRARATRYTEACRGMPVTARSSRASSANSVRRRGSRASASWMTKAGCTSGCSSTRWWRCWSGRRWPSPKADPPTCSTCYRCPWATTTRSRAMRAPIRSWPACCVSLARGESRSWLRPATTAPPHPSTRPPSQVRPSACTGTACPWSAWAPSTPTAPWLTSATQGRGSPASERGWKWSARCPPTSKAPIRRVKP